MVDAVERLSHTVEAADAAARGSAEELRRALADVRSALARLECDQRELRALLPASHPPHSHSPPVAPRASVPAPPPPPPPPATPDLSLVSPAFERRLRRKVVQTTRSRRTAPERGAKRRGNA